jgi:hypothetical protein
MRKLKFFKPETESDDDEQVPDSKVQDEETKAILFEGASVSQLGRLFSHDNRTIAKKIQGMRPTGMRAGHPIYSVAEAARFLVVPHGDFEDTIRKMRPEELPPALQKEFWSALQARQKFEEDRGDLWRTADVIAHYSEVFMALRTTLLLMSDTVERSVELSERQRSIIQNAVDTAMHELYKNLVGKFSHEPDRVHDLQDQADGSAQPARTDEGDDDPLADL